MTTTRIGDPVTCVAGGSIEWHTVAENRTNSFCIYRGMGGTCWFRRRDEGRLWIPGHDTLEAKAFAAAVLLNGGPLMTTTETTALPPKPTPFDRKRTRLQNNLTSAQTELATVTARRAAAVVDSERAMNKADLALQHAREAADAAEQTALAFVAKLDRLLDELMHVRAEIIRADEHRAGTIVGLAEAQQHMATQVAALREAGKPYDRHIAALENDVKNYQYRVEQHQARGPGATALFIGVKG